MCNFSLSYRTSPILNTLQTMLQHPQSAINEQGINLCQEFERCRKESRRMSVPNDVYERLKVILLVPQVSSILELAQRTNKSRAFVKRCLQRFYEEGYAGTLTKHRSGRPRSIRPEHHQLLFTLLEFYPSFLVKQGLFPELASQLAHSEQWTATSLASILHVNAANIRNYLKSINVNLQQKGSRRAEHGSKCQQHLHDIELLTKQINADYVVLCCGSLSDIEIPISVEHSSSSFALVESSGDLPQPLHHSQVETLQDLTTLTALNAVTEEHKDNSQALAPHNSLTTGLNVTSQSFSTFNFVGDLGITSYHQDLGTNLKASGDIATSFGVGSTETFASMTDKTQGAAFWQEAMEGQGMLPEGGQGQRTLEFSHYEGVTSDQGINLSAQRNTSNALGTVASQGQDSKTSQSQSVLVALNPLNHEVMCNFSPTVDDQAWQDFILKIEQMPQFQGKHLCLVFNKERSPEEAQSYFTPEWAQKHPLTELHFVDSNSNWVDQVNTLLYAYHGLVLSEPEWHDLESFKQHSQEFFAGYPEQEDFLD